MFFRPRFVKDGAQAALTGTASTDLISLEAGESIQVGAPLYVAGNKFYVADNVLNHNIVAIAASTASAGFLCHAATSGALTLPGLTPGAPYFLGEKVIQVGSPSSGYVIRIGQALTSDRLLVNIEEPILIN